LEDSHGDRSGDSTAQSWWHDDRLAKEYHTIKILYGEVSAAKETANAAGSKRGRQSKNAEPEAEAP